MQLLKFKIIYAFLWLISILPWKVFYLLSDFIFFVIYRIVKYRKKVVTENLRIAFPEKSYEEIKEIRKKFYVHMCDMFMEMLKSISISAEETQKHFKYTNIDVIKKLEAEGKSIIFLAAHYANYEWGNCIDLLTSKNVIGVYKPVKNKHFDEFAKKIRGRFGSKIIPHKKIIRHAISLERKEKGKQLYGLIIDQSPREVNEDSYFIPFMGPEVPVFVGAEVLAKKQDMAVTFLKVNKIKRGYYEAEVVLISDDVTKNQNFEATRTYYKMLEEQIRNKPEYYLWTHKRWKLKQ